MDQNLSANLDDSTSDDSKNTRSDHNAIRQSFRVTVGPEDGILAVLNGTTYPVADISPEGVNLFCHDNKDFTLSQVIENCELIIPEDTIKGLTAKVIHSSCGSDGKWTNGIQWTDLADADLDKIVQQVSLIKNKLRRLGRDFSG